MMKEPLKTAAVVFASISAGSLFLWPVGLFVSLFMFDAPGSENNRILVSLAWAIWTYGPVAGVGALAGFILVWRKKFKAAAIVAGLPLLHALSVVALFVALQVVCGGNFRC